MKKMLHTLALAAAIVLASAGAARADDGQFKLLVLAVPNYWHPDYVANAREGFEKLARLHDVRLTFVTRAAPTFEADLSGFAAVVLLNDPDDGFNPAQQATLERYMKAGGNTVVVHSAILLSKRGQWPWYEKLVGRNFVIHPIVQTAVVTKADPAHPAAFGLPERWVWSDEWYEFANPHGVQINPVLAVDERTYDPKRIWPGQVSNGMGADHPMSWWHNYEKGRVFVTALGHNPAAYQDDRYLNHLWGGVWWAATGLGMQAR